MTLKDTDRIAIPDTVLNRELSGESVLLDLSTEAYFGLDFTGSRMWHALTTQPHVGAAREALLDEFDVDSDRLRNDLEAFVEQLTALGLLRVEAA